jgi:Trehalose utilisation
MRSRRVAPPAIAVLLLGFLSGPAQAVEPARPLPGGITLEELPSDPVLARIVLVAGSNAYKPGEHEYLPGCVALAHLLRQTPGVFPVLAVDWPEKPETLAGARAVVMFFDGGDKHALLDSARLAQVQKLADAGAGLVALHQDVDIPVDRGGQIRGLFGAAWEKGFSQRAHWVADFKTFPDHPIFRGVAPFQIDDGWLFKLRFVPELKGVTPLLRTVSPKTPVTLQWGSEDVVSWAYERPGPAGGRSFVFTGGHLHKSLGDEGYRKFLVNGILWTAGVAIPEKGSRVALSAADLARSLEAQPGPKAP